MLTVKTDQTGRMSRLIRVFTVRTGHFVYHSAAHFIHNITGSIVHCTWNSHEIMHVHWKDHKSHNAKIPFLMTLLEHTMQGDICPTVILRNCACVKQVQIGWKLVFGYKVQRQQIHHTGWFSTNQDTGWPLDMYRSVGRISPCIVCRSRMKRKTNRMYIFLSKVVYLYCIIYTMQVINGILQRYIEN